jgi:predicted metal-dependent HD superfamily phosphohydrolase
VEEQLRASWQAALGAAAPGIDQAFDQLLGHYREPHRRYHTVKHLWHVLTTADELLGSVPAPDPAAVRLALFFHDAVYDPRSSANEATSAKLARRVLDDLGVARGRVEEVVAMVEATATHETGPRDLDLAVVNDADLAVLAGTPAVYAAYVNGVRAEYSHVDDEGWRSGRTQVLRRFLDRARIYATAPMQANEARARANLAAELAGLTWTTGGC